MHQQLDERQLEGLPELFMAAMTARGRGDVDKAAQLLGDCLRREPRLAEPRLELGRIHLDAGRLDDAEAETREALDILERGGQWLETVSESELRSLAHGQLAEVLRQRADSDEIIFGDPEVWRALLKEAKHHFAQATELDSTNTHASYHGFFLGLAEDEDAEPVLDDPPLFPPLALDEDEVPKFEEGD